MKLFVTFVDFTKAYDLVPGKKLFTVLKRLECGMVMLSAVVAMYRVTAVLTATLGVRQGTPTCCVLFVIFVNELKRIIKEQCIPEDFIQWLHILVLLDDTVLLATSRESMIKKVKILQEFCSDYEMVINESKTKFS